MIRMARLAMGILAGAGVLGVLLGCRHVASSKSSEGQTSFQMIAPLAQSLTVNSRLSLSIEPLRDVFVEAKPILPLANPVYPAAARAAKLGVVTVSIHITVDTSGKVSGVAPGLASFSLPNRFASEFQAAVETALAQWLFTPAEIQHLEESPGENGQSYLRLASREKIEAGCDILFTFTATGEVWTGLPPKGR